MATQTAVLAPNRVLADHIPAVRPWIRDLTLVLGGTVATGISAQLAIDIPAISPVPFVFTTLTVLLISAAYGPVRAVASMLCYLAAGMAGMPWFSGAAHGAVPTVGYVLGFVLAAAVVGALARRGGDRTALRTAMVMVLGSACIYAVGVPYLVIATGMDWSQGIVQGAGVFIVGDVIKLAAATVLLPTCWALIKKLKS